MHIKTLFHQSKWALLTFLFIAFFLRLGFWQLDRAQQKIALQESFQQRMQHYPLNASALRTLADGRFYPVKLQGSFDNDHTFLLDNKIFHGKVGYEVYTPFHVQGLENAILVDRGFIPQGLSRTTLPLVPSFTDTHMLEGFLNTPPGFVTLGNLQESTATHWPLRVQFIELEKLATLLNYPLFPYIVHIDPKQAAALTVEWRIITMSPEKHQGYAVQWFALALTLLILFIALHRRRS